MIDESSLSDPSKSSEEMDDLLRSIKKIKSNCFHLTPILYKDKLVQTKKFCSLDVQSNVLPAFLDDLSNSKEPMDGIPTIKVTKAYKLRIREPFLQTVIGKVLDKTVGYKYFDFKPLNSLLKNPKFQNLWTVQSIPKHVIPISKIFTWSAKGVVNQSFRQHLLEYLNIHKPRIVIITETKISGTVAQHMCDSLPFSRRFILDAQGFRCGIWILWNEDEIIMEIVNSSNQSVQAVV
ncbi:hypothetical protein ACH5RR_038622 [Cinchona calisaya]|uniref:Uncharacterized protein n=1 Tax=Cinchona calisaya TaxID=153742 RepID=A0ABD2XVU4_9GENT